MASWIVRTKNGVSCQILVAAVYVDVPLELLASGGLELEVLVQLRKDALNHYGALGLGIVFSIG